MIQLKRLTTEFRRSILGARIPNDPQFADLPANKLEYLEIHIRPFNKGDLVLS